MSGSVVIFLQADDYEAAWLAGSIALSAAAAGDAVTLVLSFGPLKAWVEERLGEDGSQTRARGESLGAASPMRLVTQARELGAKLVACETVVQLTGLLPAAVRERLDEVTGLQSIWKRTTGARVLSF